ncbi:MAG: LamG domain-containing protein, partial [Candidatus Aenigmatarchaeota archaeon]
LIILGITIGIAGLASSFIFDYASMFTSQMIDIKPGSTLCNNGGVSIFVTNAGSAPIMLSDRLIQKEKYESDANTVGLWHFDEGSGAISADSSLYGNSGRLGNWTLDGSQPVWITGAFGSGLEFDGLNDYINMSDVVDMGVSNFTVEAWFKKDSYAGFMKIVNKGMTSSGTPVNAGYQIRTRNISNMEIIEFGAIDAAGNYYHVNATGSLVGEWHHVAGIFDRTGSEMYLYLDGELVNTTSVPPTFGSVDTDSPFGIGALVRPSPDHDQISEFFNGVIDEVRVLNVTKDFTQKEPEWGYTCEGSGNSYVCGDILILREGGTGEFIPVFEETIIKAGKTMRFRDLNCNGKCDYTFSTPSISKKVGVSCYPG